MEKYAVVLVERPIDEGLSLPDFSFIYSRLSGNRGYVLEVEGTSSYAAGVITEEAAETVSYGYAQGSDLYHFLSEILSNMEKESADHSYIFNDIRILMTRSVTSEVCYEI